MLTTFHLVVLKRGFMSGEFNEDYTENVDETHFIVDYDNSRILNVVGSQTVKYVVV